MLLTLVYASRPSDMQQVSKSFGLCEVLGLSCRTLKAWSWSRSVNYFSSVLGFTQLAWSLTMLMIWFILVGKLM